MHQGNDEHFIPMTSVSSGSGKAVKEDVYYYTNQIVNVVFIGNPDGPWVLVDAGMPDSGEKILEVAEERFGKNNPPAAIILTHGHFDHVGGITFLIKKWGVSVYAHPLEFPFLTGEQAYPEPDPSVEGGVLAKLSSIYPIEPVDIREALVSLPNDSSIPCLPEWRWIHTPGHSPGHVSLFRVTDGVLLSGDAFVTVRQDSLYKVLVQKEEVHGPPRYLTTDWAAAWDSVARLELLDPKLVIAGHGQYMEGEELEKGLRQLVANFDRLAIPDHGKYVHKSDD
jgi:glyoxylase-like metal-dependent hydrolase (beta-lactamase superfamily II)